MTLCVKGIREGQNIDYPTEIPHPLFEKIGINFGSSSPPPLLNLKRGNMLKRDDPTQRQPISEEHR
jgi:hypothetical protein